VHACAQGERVTWAKLPAIQANCGIEMTLDKCMLELSEVMAMKKQVAGLYRMARPHGQRAAPGKLPSRQRIPSWINLSAMGEALPSWRCGQPVPCCMVNTQLVHLVFQMLSHNAMRGPMQ
jgi:hypothetical protein